MPHTYVELHEYCEEVTFGSCNASSIFSKHLLTHFHIFPVFPRLFCSLCSQHRQNRKDAVAQFLERNISTDNDGEEDEIGDDGGRLSSAARFHLLGQSILSLSGFFEGLE